MTSDQSSRRTNAWVGPDNEPWLRQLAEIALEANDSSIAGLDDVELISLTTTREYLEEAVLERLVQDAIPD